MVSLLVVQIIKYRFGVPVVAMLSRIYVMSRCTVNYVIVEITSLVPGKKYGTVAEYRAGIHGI